MDLGAASAPTPAPTFCPGKSASRQRLSNGAFYRKNRRFVFDRTILPPDSGIAGSRLRFKLRSSTDDAVYVEKDENASENRLFLEQLEPDNLTKEVATLAFPAFIGQAIEPLALLTETAYIGRLGTVELAAVGVSISAFNYVSKCFNIPLLNVTTSFVAEDEVINQSNTNHQTSKLILPAVSSALVLGTLIGVIEAYLLISQGKRMLGMLGITPDSVMAMPARNYLALRALASPAAVLSLALQGIFRGLKDTKTPLYATAIGSVSNIVLGPILMFALGYGVRGAAFAYLASQCTMMCYLLWCLNKRVILLPPRVSNLKFDRFLKSGGLLLGRTLATLSAMTFSTSMAARQGALSMAAHQVCMQLWLATSMLSDSLALAVQALLASAFAKGNYRRAELVTNGVLQMALALGLAMALVLGISSEVIAKMFTSDAGVLKVMAVIMPYVAVTQPINALAFVLDGIHYGASDFRYACYTMIFNSVVASSIMFYAPSIFGLSGVWLGLSVFMGLRASLGYLRLFLATGPWTFLRENRKGATVNGVA